VYFEQLREKIAAMPEVVEAGISTNATPPSNGWGQREGANRTSAFGGGGSGWQSREASARGSASRGGGGGWHGRR